MTDAAGNVSIFDCPLCELTEAHLIALRQLVATLRQMEGDDWRAQIIGAKYDYFFRQAQRLEMLFEVQRGYWPPDAFARFEREAKEINNVAVYEISETVLFLFCKKYDLDFRDEIDGDTFDAELFLMESDELIKDAEYLEKSLLLEKSSLEEIRHHLNEVTFSEFREQLFCSFGTLEDIETRQRHEVEKAQRLAIDEKKRVAKLEREVKGLQKDILKNAAKKKRAKSL